MDSKLDVEMEMRLKSRNTFLYNHSTCLPLLAIYNAYSHPVLSSFPSFSIPDVLCDPTDIN